jgi:hypothetical protein
MGSAIDRAPKRSATVTAKRIANVATLASIVPNTVSVDALDQVRHSPRVTRMTARMVDFQVPTRRVSCVAQQPNPNSRAKAISYALDNADYGIDLEDENAGEFPAGPTHSSGWVARWWCAAPFVTAAAHRSHSASSATRRLGERTK